ncbi:MAG: hypothetical protein CYPHOPRED_004237 [Cyphobasidiales sp. Tagirdzhanova-0007]|nr:MAG: hypothetical protein CYPHOPRED_004237 [Cyphobasidiales sp. Tagirdzhanova-0007]
MLDVDGLKVPSILKDDATHLDDGGAAADIQHPPSAGQSRKRITRACDACHSSGSKPSLPLTYSASPVSMAAGVARPQAKPALMTARQSDVEQVDSRRQNVQTGPRDFAAGELVTGCELVMDLRSER